ncbi:hypothetical protein MOE96_21525 [Bacillus inaquosorum]|uniref:hypothetical protein n=1 Tax=Bacillus inaquosorum TaxID=483913 RepID=UPI002281CE99|nr:hypothetical protein [Bacillus inaquosorum]MCY9097431.1 hypothetical protein [Bacillus inaquosorum]
MYYCQPYFYVPIPYITHHYPGNPIHNRNSYQKTPLLKRGKVKNIVFEIEYPDGTTKATLYKNADKISRIIFDPKFIPQKDLKLFNVSKDWRENPAFIAYEYPSFSTEIETGLPVLYDRPNPRPYCTRIRCGLIEVPTDIFMPGGPLDL